MWKEVKGLLERGTFKFIAKEDIPSDAKLLPGRFVLTIKDSNCVVRYKALFMIGGHSDAMKNFIVHISQNKQPWSARLVLTLAAIFGFEVWVSDVRQAYLQSEELI